MKRLLQEIENNPHTHLWNAAKNVARLEIANTLVCAVLFSCKEQPDHWIVCINRDRDDAYKFESFIHELIHISLHQLGCKQFRKHNEELITDLSKRLIQNQRLLCLELLMHCTWKTPSSS